MRFRMKFDDMARLTTAVAGVLLQLLLLVVATGSASPLRNSCGVNRFYDSVAQICTNCDEICDPRRGALYLCQQHADECSSSRE